MNNFLTVVIPYYKRRFLDAALASLAGQTDKNFKVFIGDDGSPEDPAEIIQKYRGQLEINYRRFPDNLGRTSLVRHWNRCVRETNSEWVWLFSDDDVAATDCVESFAETLSETRGSFEIYRFNIKVINEEGVTVEQPASHPTVETGDEFALEKIKGTRFSFAVEYIFRRKVFDTADGFVDFPLAWCSDDASWIAFARKNGIRTIEGGGISWRKSSLNLSAPKPEHIKKKLAAFRSYLVWLRKEFPDPAFQQNLCAEVARRFPDTMNWWGKPGLMEGVKFWFFFARFTGQMNVTLLRKLLGISCFKRT